MIPQGIDAAFDFARVTDVGVHTASDFGGFAHKPAVGRQADTDGEQS